MNKDLPKDYIEEETSKILNVLTSTLTKKGIKQTIPGNLAVLNPTQDFSTMYFVSRIARIFA